LLYLCQDSGIYIKKHTFMCHLPSSITAQSWLYMMHHAQSRLVGNDVMAPYVERGPNQVAI
jgi:hypothetical protein